jgi:hypothetical protein
LPYFSPLLFAGEVISLDHLEPFHLMVPTQAKPSGVRIDVVFSNHCFSEVFDPARHVGPRVEIADGRVRRVFDKGRYQLSRALPEIVRGLPSAPVFQTPEANFVRIVIPVPAGGPGTEYRMFFRLKKDGVVGADLKLRVESAYCPSPGQALSTAFMSKVRFTVLVDKTLRGEPLKFHRKR